MMELIIKIKDTATLDRIDEFCDYLKHMKTLYPGSQHLETCSGHFADVIEGIEMKKV